MIRVEKGSKTNQHSCHPAFGRLRLLLFQFIRIYTQQINRGLFAYTLQGFASSQSFLLLAMPSTIIMQSFHIQGMNLLLSSYDLLLLFYY